MKDFDTRLFLASFQMSFGGGGIFWGGVGRRQTRVLFGENLCRNEGIGSCWGGADRGEPLNPPM